ncbi:hypothetical protein SDC9_192609 [bioreactor metagenome]|uniref:Uncharacterized protein n=1 Tax=bioreactor metagenome TaxID=1076179 RepID=A0A645I2Q5_9ZZZZ
MARDFFDLPGIGGIGLIGCAFHQRIGDDHIQLLAGKALMRGIFSHESDFDRSPAGVDRNFLAEAAVGGFAPQIGDPSPVGEGGQRSLGVGREVAFRQNFRDDRFDQRLSTIKNLIGGAGRFQRERPGRDERPGEQQGTGDQQ